MKARQVLAIFFIAFFGLSQLAIAQTSRRHRVPRGFDDGINGKWEVRFSLGAEKGSYNDQALLFDLGVGYNITSNFYLGLASGAYPFFGAVDNVESTTFIPVLLDFAFRTNPDNDRWSPYIGARAGYLIPTDISTFLTTDGVTPYERAGYTTLELGPGINLRPVRNIDLRLSLNYGLTLPSDDGFQPESRNHVQHMLQFRMGIAFRGKLHSPSRSVMLEDQARINAQRRREYEADIARQRAKEEADRRHADEERAARRRQRQSPITDASGVAIVNESQAEFFCHITPEMVADGASLENNLIRLATMAATHEATGIVVMGYSPDDETDVIVANGNADNVRSYLIRRYVIDKNLISTAFSGFEQSLSGNTPPKGAIATILVQKAAK